MLAPWREQMTYPQLATVIVKMNLQSVDPETELAWRVAIDSKSLIGLELGLDESFDFF